VLSVFIFIWFGDSAAYGFGTWLGRHRLFPRISPKKSWEGCIAAFVMAIGVSQVIASFNQSFTSEDLPNRLAWAGLAIVVIGFGTWGDLVESQIKRKLGIKDSAIIICEDVAQLYLQYGSLKDAAITLGAAIRPLIDIGDYGKAKSYMDLYEAKSERFDTMGNIEHGREIYYKAKGLYYLNTGKLDSAEYFFRKELQNGSDFNNLHAAAKGLAELYQILKRPDSVAKYFAYAYAMNDSLYAQTTAKDIERIHSAYNYSRHQEEAYRESVKSERANRFLLISCIILLTIFLIATWLSIALKKMTKAFERMSDELEQLKTERTELLQNKSDNLMELEEKEQRIKQLKKKMGRYGKLIYFSPNKANTAMEKSSRYKEIKEKGLKGEKFSADDWTTVQCLVNEYLPGFYDFINLRLKAESKEYKVCELLRLSFEVKEIANAFGVTPPYISKISSKIYQEVFKKQGSSKDLAKEILKLA
jgi:dolichol kinase